MSDTILSTQKVVALIKRHESSVSDFKARIAQIRCPNNAIPLTVPGGKVYCGSDDKLWFIAA